MLAILGNLSVGETLVVVALAVIVFGKRLPEVAGQAMRQARKLRHALDDLRRESGIDRELHEVRRGMRDVAREARVEDPLKLSPVPPPRPRTVRSEPVNQPPREPEPSPDEPGASESPDAPEMPEAPR